MHTAEIAEEAIRLGYMKGTGTGNLHPHKRIYGAISKHLNNRGKQWFHRVAPATFTLKSGVQRKNSEDCAEEFLPESRREDLEELEKLIQRNTEKAVEEESENISDIDEEEILNKMARPTDSVKKARQKY